MDSLVSGSYPYLYSVVGHYGDFGGVFAMGHYRRFAALLFLSCLVGAALTYASADEPAGEEPIPDVVESPVSEEYPLDSNPTSEELLQSILDLLLEVTSAPVEEADVFDYVPEPFALSPDGFPFYGSCWVQGTVPSLGSVSLFFPSNYKEGYIGVDSAGRLFNVSNTTWTGVMYVNSSTSYTVNFPAFALPTYRVYSGSTWTTPTLYLTPTESNLIFPDGPSPTYSISDLLPYLVILLLGGIFVCCMKR